MSVEDLKEYARRCATEPELRAAARELGASDIEGHVRHAAGLGLDWTMDDMAAFRKEVLDAEGDFDSLSEEELEQVAGGAVSTTVAIVAGILATVAGGAVVGAAAGGAVVGGTVAATGGSGW